MSNQERFARKSRFTTSAKAVSIVLTVGFVALLVARTPMPMTEESRGARADRDRAIGWSDGSALD